MPQTEGLILTDPALMTLFELAAFVKTGVTRRGLSRAQVLPEVRGAFSGEVLVDTLVQVSRDIGRGENEASQVAKRRDR